MQSSNLIKWVVISIFTVLAMGCSKGSEDSGGDSTWNPRDLEALERESRDYKTMDYAKYSDENIMTARDQFIEKLLPGDPVGKSFLEYLNLDYNSEQTQFTEVEAAENFIATVIATSLETKTLFVDHSKDLKTRHDQSKFDYEETVSQRTPMTVMGQILQIIGELKRTQSNGQSYWGDRDIKRVSLVNQIMQERREDQIDKEKWLAAMGYGVTATVGGLAIVLLPKVVTRGFWSGLHNLLHGVGHRTLSLIQKMPLLGGLIKKGPSLGPEDILKRATPTGFGFRTIKYIAAHASLSGEARAHFSNTLKIRNHVANLLYSIQKKAPSGWKIKGAKQANELAESAKKLSNRVKNLAFIPRFSSSASSAEDDAIHYFVTAHRASKDQTFDLNYRAFYQDAIDEIDLSESQITEFKRQFTTLVKKHGEAGQLHSDLALATEEKYFLAQLSLIKPNAGKAPAFGKYGEELDYAWNPSQLIMTEVVYTDTMLKRLLYLREHAGTDLEKNFLDEAIDLVYKTQKYDVVNLDSMKLILKKNNGKVEKVFVGSPVGSSERTAYELKAMTTKADGGAEPMKQAEMTQDEFLDFMDESVKAIRRDEVLTKVVGPTEMGLATVGYMPLSKTAGRAFLAAGTKQFYKDLFDLSPYQKQGLANRLAKKAVEGPARLVGKIKDLPKRIINLGESSKKKNQVWSQYLYKKPKNVETAIQIIKKKIPTDINSFVKRVNELTEEGIEESLELTAALKGIEHDSVTKNFLIRAIDGINEYPLASVLYKDLKKAIDDKEVKLNLVEIKAYLRKQAPKHIKAQERNLEDVVAPMLNDSEFLAQIIEYASINSHTMSKAMRAIFNNEGLKGLSIDQAETRLLIDLHHSISDAIFHNSAKASFIAKDSSKFTNTKKSQVVDSIVNSEQVSIVYKNVLEHDIKYWTPSFYDKHIDGILKITENPILNKLIILSAGLTAAGLSYSMKRNIIGIDFHGGMFIDESVNAVNYESITENNEYKAFKEFGTK